MRKSPARPQERLVPLFGSDVGAQQEVLVDPDRTADLAAQSVQPRQGEIGIDLVRIDPDGTREQILGGVEVALENAAQRLAHHGIHVPRRAPLAPEPAPEPAHGPHALRLAIPPSSTFRVGAQRQSGISTGEGQIAELVDLRFETPDRLSVAPGDEVLLDHLVAEGDTRR